MRKYIYIIITAALLSGGVDSLHAVENPLSYSGNTETQITPFTGLSENTVNSFIGYNFFFHAGAVASTYVIIESGADYNVHNYFAENKDKYNAASLPAVYLGYIGPLALGFGLYSAGYADDDVKTLAAGCAVLQASLLAFSYTSVLKTFTGRSNPDSGVYNEDSDNSDEFQWGFMNNGIHYGWPSGHMAVSTAVISSMAYFYDDSMTVKIIGGIVWSYMAFGVTAHEGNTMHWFSDVVAGSLMGFAIGSTVGADFRQRLTNGKNFKPEGAVHFSPLITGNQTGLVVSMTF